MTVILSRPFGSLHSLRQASTAKEVPDAHAVTQIRGNVP
jgi:hypothetical protein